MTKWVFIKVGELKNRKWDLKVHLISAIDLNLFQPLDLEITQKSLWITQKSLGVILKEEKEEKIIHSFMSRLGEGEQESKGDFWTRRRKRQQFGTHTRQLFSKIRTAERQVSRWSVGLKTDKFAC